MKRALLIFLWLVIMAKGVFAQMYVPPAPHEMWDTWLFQDGKDFHLFFLQYEPGHGYSAIGHAVSKDLIHWTPLPKIATDDDTGAWDCDPVLGTLTGCTVKFEGKYWLFYGSAAKGQQIGVMTSTDLIHWTKHPSNPLLSIKPPYTGWAWRDLGAVWNPNEKLWHAYVCSQYGPQTPKIPIIKDKTLVAWVYTADPKQNGGGVLTLDYGPFHSDVFDGIIFGEREPGKWMAGSNITGGPGYRTQEDQSANPAETAGPDELIQIAAVYRGKQVTIYRNGEVYVDYPISEPASFGDGTAFLIGLRNIGADKSNPASFFGGSVEEARIYDTALDAESIRSLKLNDVSGLEPFAQWTFEDGTTKDSMGRFPDGRLIGGAHIADGKLHLDGIDDYMNTGNDGVTPLEMPLGSVAHLTSKDLLHWDYHEPVLTSTILREPEVPDYFEMNGRHYMIANAGAVIYYTMSDRREGPYTMPKNPILFGRSKTPSFNYVGRTIPYKDGRLFYYQTMGGRVMWGVPKIVRQNPDGTLWLQYWGDLKKLETEVLLKDFTRISIDDRFGDGRWQAVKSRVDGSTSGGQPSILWLTPAESDTLMRAKVLIGDEGTAGIVFRWDGTSGLALTLNAKTDTAEMQKLTLKDGKLTFESMDDYAEEARDYQGVWISKGSQDVRLLIRAHRVEVYLNDRAVMGISIPDSPKKGRIGLLTQSGSAGFSNLRIAKIEPMLNMGE